MIKFDKTSVKKLKWLFDGRSILTRNNINYEYKLNGINVHNGHGISSNGISIRIARNLFDPAMSPGLYDFSKVATTKKTYAPELQKENILSMLLQVTDSMASAKFQRVDIDELKMYLKPFKKIDNVFFTPVGGKLVLSNMAQNTILDYQEIQIFVSTGINWDIDIAFDVKRLYKMLAPFKGSAYMAIVERYNTLLTIANSELAIGLVARRKI